MSGDGYHVGDMVTVLLEDGHKKPAVISSPIEPGRTGYALMIRDGFIVGASVTAVNVTLAEKGTQGFAQLASNLIKLGSHVIEKRLIGLVDVG